MLALLAQQNKKTAAVFFTFLLVIAHISGLRRQHPDTDIESADKETLIDTKTAISESAQYAVGLTSVSTFHAAASASPSAVRTVTETDKSTAAALFVQYQNRTDEKGRKLSMIEQYKALDQIVSLLGGYADNKRLNNLNALFVTHEEWSDIFAGQSFRTLEDIRRNHLTRAPSDIIETYENLKLVREIATKLERADRRFTFGSILAQAQIAPEYLYKQELLNQNAAYEKTYDLYQSLKSTSGDRDNALLRELKTYTGIVNQGPDNNLVRRLAEYDFLARSRPPNPQQPSPNGN